jgi:3-dehydroquinate dehydratase/shikimate dehydrogenase
VAKICLCLTAKTIARNLKIVHKYRTYADIAELRVDCLDPDERFYIRNFPELAGMPVILTIRRKTDGGYFTGGEGARVRLLANGLAYANADHRKNYAYVDIEEDIIVPSLEEAVRTFGTRIIRSIHSVDGNIDNIGEKLKSMHRTGDEIVKAAVTVKTTADVLRIFRETKACVNMDKIIVCMGHYGIFSRILAEKIGSYITYASALSENEVSGAPGQLDIKELAQMYRFRRINRNTKVYGIAGCPLKSTISPWFFNTVFTLENTDAVYVPFPTDSAVDLLELAKEIDIYGLSVTVPYKEAVIPALVNCSKAVSTIGSCNTIYRSTGGWFGENTDATGFSDSLLAFLELKNLKRQKITIIGAGGVARAVAAEIHRYGGKALILNRTVNKARNIALQYNFRWGGLDNQGIEIMTKFSDIIIQTTSAGMEGHDAADPLELYAFTGKEAVMDLIYTPAQTPFLKRAAEAGCRTLNGYDMVIRQACLQYFHFFGREIPQQILSRVNTGDNTQWNKIQTD